MDIRIKFAQKIKELRTDQNLTQEQLATKAKVSLRTIANIENASFNARVETIEKIANSLNSTLEINSIKS